MTDKKVDTEAALFIQDLMAFADDFLMTSVSSECLKKANKLLSNMEKFDFIGDFDSHAIIGVYNAVRINLMKWERFADRQNNEAIKLKSALDSMLEIIEEVYFSEIFGFFSTSLRPATVPELNLPCNIFCGCADGWQKEPYLNEDGSVSYENVIRFKNSTGSVEEKGLLCMTISSQPRILESKEKCVFSNAQIEALKNFVAQNKDIIILHNAEIIDSPSFVEAVRLRSSPEKHQAKYLIRFKTNERQIDFSDKQVSCCVALSDMTYEEAKDFYEKLKAELKAAPANEKNGDFWLEDFDVLAVTEDETACPHLKNSLWERC